MKKLLVFLIMGAMCGRYVAAQQKEMVFPPLEGWEKARETREYNPGNLFDYINGAADAFLSYDFVHLWVKEYTNDSGAMIKAEVYEHKDVKHAFGIYSIERSPEYDFIPVGGQAYQIDDILNMSCGKYYVKLHGYDLEENDQSQLTDLARALATDLDKDAGLPGVLRKFPEMNRQPHSGMYIAENFLGFEFLSNAFTSVYQMEDQKFQLFLIQEDSPAGCREMLESYIEFTGQDIEILNDELIWINDRYNGDIYVIWEGSNIFGTVECAEKQTCHEYLTMFKKNINE